MQITISTGTGAGVSTSVRFYDISGAAASPFDTSKVLTSVNVTNQLSLSNAPLITPRTVNGLVIAVLQLGQGPGLGIFSPIGTIWDLVTYKGETDIDLMDNADGNGHIYNATTATQNWSWIISSIANNSASAVAAAFISACCALGGEINSSAKPSANSRSTSPLDGVRVKPSRRSDVNASTKALSEPSIPASGGGGHDP
jgi:hypothetical protein